MQQAKLASGSILSPLLLRNANIVWPGEDVIDAISLEVSCLMALFGLNLAFALYNVVRFVFCQGRYKIFLIAAFYALSIVVLVCRLVYYGYVLAFFSKNDQFIT